MIGLCSKGAPNGVDENQLGPVAADSEHYGGALGGTEPKFQGEGGGGAVSFQWKNPDFLLKNADFLPSES